MPFNFKCHLTCDATPKLRGTYSVFMGYSRDERGWVIIEKNFDPIEYARNVDGRSLVWPGVKLVEPALSLLFWWNFLSGGF